MTTPWLQIQQNKVRRKKLRYYHFHCVEQSNQWDAAYDELTEYFRNAHDDAVKHLESLLGTSLHPASVSGGNPYSRYPFGLPEVTLQGYFGEILAGWLAEQYSPGDLSGWKVPAHLFRIHVQAFQYLERLSQTETAPSSIVGRTGDDCLAFRIDDEGKIISVLFCEAKCTLTHNASLIRDAHEKAGDGAIVDIPQIIDILKSRNSQEDRDWIDRLRLFHLQLHSNEVPENCRHDLICYVHSRVPQRTPTWIKTDTPHSAYRGRRPLSVFEVRLDNVRRRIHAIYSLETWS